MFCPNYQDVFIHSDPVDKTCPFTLILPLPQSLLLDYIREDMKGLNPNFALIASKNMCAKTDSVFSRSSEVSTRMVTLYKITRNIFQEPNNKPIKIECLNCKTKAEPVMDYVVDLIVEDKNSDIVILTVFRRVLNISIKTIDKEETEQTLSNEMTGKEILFDAEDVTEEETQKMYRAMILQVQ